MAKMTSEQAMGSRSKLYDRQEILFKVENDERGFVREIAKAMGMSMNEYCRMAVMERAQEDKERMEREAPRWVIIQAEFPIPRTEKYERGTAFNGVDPSECTIVEEFDSKEAADLVFNARSVSRGKISARFDMCNDYALAEMTIDKKTGETVRGPRILRYAKLR